MLYQVAIKTPLRKLFTYDSEKELPRGARVKVPFRNQEKIGFVMKPAQQAPKGLKSIIELIDESPLFDESAVQFYEWAATYYGISVGELLSSSMPKQIRDGKAIPDVDLKHFVPEFVELNKEQQMFVDKLKSRSGFQKHLLLGETGSGKTEVYLQLMEDILLEGGQILFLVPEISLTPQLEQRLTKRLGTSVSIFHSDLKGSVRLQSFASAWKGQTDVFLGARSALFLPYTNLKLIIVDEEHDSSYKQSERAPYHARDLAILRAKQLGIPIVLGSATPSLETYVQAVEGEESIHRLPKYFETPKPQIEVIDLKETWKEETKSFIGSRLHEAIESCLDRKEQALLFLNRRGSASQRICTNCGAMDECLHCSSRLTIHFDLNQAICHLCGYKKQLSQECSDCGSKDFFMGGVGTKEIETQIQERFPEAKVARLDRDQTQKRGKLAAVLEDFSKHKIDILVGTQMISKGIDIPNLTTVGIVLADQGWSIPDFRALERSYQLLHQILGRAGRRGQSSRCLIQSFTPEHPIFNYFVEGKGFEVFAGNELELRKASDLPPFSRLMLWNFSDKDQRKLEMACQNFMKRVGQLGKSLGLELYGPVPAPIFKWKNQYRYQLLVKSKEVAKLSTFMTTVLDDLDRQSLGVKVKVDRDPAQFL